MNKPIVFISHIASEKEMAIAFKELAESSFLDMLDVFVSSDEHSISMGQKWLNDITHALQTCSIEIILCSPQSVVRPWINFEAGAGWIRNIPVIPLCHSGMEPSKLPLPLNVLQAAKMSEIASLNLILPVLAKAIGSTTPKVDFTDFVQKVKDFELKYTFWDQCNLAFQKLAKHNGQIITALRDGKKVTFDLTETDIYHFSQFMPFLTERDILKFERTGSMSVTKMGAVHGCALTPLSKLQSTMLDSHFRV